MWARWKRWRGEVGFAPSGLKSPLPLGEGWREGWALGGCGRDTEAGWGVFWGGVPLTQPSPVGRGLSVLEGGLGYLNQQYLQDAGQVCQHIPVPESYDAEAGFGDVGGSFGVSLLGVLAAVEFHHQTGCYAEEVYDVRAERDLTAEFEASEAAVADGEPEGALGGGLVEAEVGGVPAAGLMEGAH